jgi:hypothetical protein
MVTKLLDTTLIGYLEGRRQARDGLRPHEAVAGRARLGMELWSAVEA